ncbi:hypothetical protein JD844_016903 [Phrynosoma platyrhinos]|uniref:Ubiquitinyl hydrolase 1 n=1 Tax=Phrynosoma platyrhinos TaxID=52577 RepID=A0ABQ7SL14_PHRPL|nr:hypothetical protein JD844_016903 [Phrynosoma platyrhinos]
MSRGKDEPFCTPTEDGTVALATAAASDENKLTDQRLGPESQVCTSPGITTLTDSTKRVKLSSASQEEDSQECPAMSQQKTRSATDPSVTTEEKRKKRFFGIQFPKSKKEKCTPREKMAPTCTSTSHKGKPALVDKEDSALSTKRAQREGSKMSEPHQDNSHNSRGKLSTSVISCPMESSVDFEEDMYRDAEEIEREKVLLECGTGSSDFLENKLSVEPEVDIMDYCQEEWRGNTAQAKCIRKGYEAVSHRFISIRRVRGDNYCAVRATLFQALSQATQLPDWLQGEDMVMWKNMAEMKTHIERQAACDELFRSEDDEYKVYEAVKFLMLNIAIKLYEDNEKGKEVPVFAWLLFARDTSSNPSQLMENHLNQLGHTGGLEQVEMFLLAYALQHTIQVYRLYKYSTDEFITFYPNEPEEDWPIVTLITEDDRHYNIPARMCKETSL